METEGSGKQNDKPLPVGVRAVPETDTPQYVRTPGTGMPRKARHFIGNVESLQLPRAFGSLLAFDCALQD